MAYLDRTTIRSGSDRADLDRTTVRSSSERADLDQTVRQNASRYWIFKYETEFSIIYPRFFRTGISVRNGVGGSPSIGFIDDRV